MKNLGPRWRNPDSRPRTLWPEAPCCALEQDPDCAQETEATGFPCAKAMLRSRAVFWGPILVRWKPLLRGEKMYHLHLRLCHTLNLWRLTWNSGLRSKKCRSNGYISNFRPKSANQIAAFFSHWNPVPRNSFRDKILKKGFHSVSSTAKL